jgi:hypothetical protein
MINRMPRVGEKLIYHSPRGDENYVVDSHYCKDNSILNIVNSETGEHEQIIAEFRKGEFNRLLDFN